MKKRKFLNYALLAAVLFASGMPKCNARIAPERAAIGGISYKASIDYVIGIYGEPDNIVRSSVYRWGDGFEVNTLQSPYVRGVTIFEPNGIATQDGVCVGMEIGVLNETYGTPDHMDVDKEGNTVYAYESGRGCLMFRVKDEVIQQIDLVAGYN